MKYQNKIMTVAPIREVAALTFEDIEAFRKDVEEWYSTHTFFEQSLLRSMLARLEELEIEEEHEES